MKYRCVVGSKPQLPTKHPNGKELTVSTPPVGGSTATNGTYGVTPDWIPISFPAVTFSAPVVSAAEAVTTEPMISTKNVTPIGNGLHIIRCSCPPATGCKPR